MQIFAIRVDDTFLIRLKLFDVFFIEVPFLHIVGSTKTKFRMRFNNHKTGIRRHGNLDHVQRDQDDLIYKHFWGHYESLFHENAMKMC